MKLPIQLVALDGVGAMFIALGALCCASSTLVPEMLRSLAYGIPFIAVGLALMVPLVLWVLRNVGGPRAR